MNLYSVTSAVRRVIRLGGHWALRTFNSAPDQLRARSLGRQIARHQPALPDHSEKFVLFMTPRSWSSHVHWEGLIASALRLRGARVEFITCGGGLARCDRATTHEAPPMPCRSCSKYTHATLGHYGFDLIPMIFNDAPPWPELDTMNIRELMAVTYREVPIGKLVEIPTKWFLLNTQLETDPLGTVSYRAFLRSAKQVVDELIKIFESKRPDVLVLLNGLFFFESIAWEIARRFEVDVVNYERGYIIDTLMFDRDEPACFGFLDEIWPAFSEIELTSFETRQLNDYLADRRVGRRAIEDYWTNVDTSTLYKRPGRQLVTLFTNLTWDSAVINKEIAFDSIHDWIHSTLSYFINHSEHDLVIRIHPAEVRLSGKPTREPVADFISANFPTLPPNIRIVHPDNPASSYVLMAESDVVTVLTSTTGLEAALAGVPVIVSGQTAYRGKGFTIDVSSESEYWQMLDEVLARPELARPKHEIVERYAHLFFFKLPIPFEGLTEHIRGIVRLNTKKINSLSHGASPSMDRICDGILNGGRFRPQPTVR